MWCVVVCLGAVFYQRFNPTSSPQIIQGMMSYIRTLHSRSPCKPSLIPRPDFSIYVDELENLTYHCTSCLSGM